MQRSNAPRLVALVAVAAWAAPIVPLAAHGDDARANSIVVTGCVSGGVLSEVSAVDNGSGKTFAPRYRLAGAKAIVKEIKRDHAGHLDQFTGVITGDNGAVGVGPKVDLGKLSVRVGGNPHDPPNAARVPETPVFEVSSFLHTDAKCP